MSEVDPAGGAGANEGAESEWTRTRIQDLQRRLVELERAAALADSPAFLAAIVESSTDAIYGLNLDGIVASWNSSAVRMFGYTPEEIVGKPEAVLLPRDREAEARHLLAAIRSGQPGGHFETRYVRKDGSTFVASLTASAIRDVEQRLFGVSKIVRDVTVRTRSERGRDVELRLRTALGASGVGTWRIDVPTKRIIRDVRMNRLLALSDPEAETDLDGHLDAIYTEDRNRVAAAVRAAIEDGEDYAAEFRIVLADGGVRWLRDRGSLVHDPDGTPLYLTGSCIDVTAERRAQERYRLLFENSPVPMWVYDVATFRFLAVNPAALRHYGYTAEEFLAMTLEDIRPKEDIPKLHEDLKIAVRDFTGQNWRQSPAETWRHLKKDGTIIHCEVRAHPIVFDDRPARMVMSLDVTERIVLEEQLRQSQKMEAVGQLSGGIAHDFNNLLTVINGYVALALESVPETSELVEYLKPVASAGNRAAALTQQLLAFSRKQMMQPKILNLNEVIRSIETILKRLIREDIEFVSKLDPDLEAVEADPHQLEQVLMNLVINAGDAMPLGGTLTIETRRVTLDADYVRGHLGSAPGQFIMLAVSDTGVGMDAQTLSHVFEPFFTTKRPGKGTGLGLSTVYGIVKQSGGSINAYSEPGIGTSFKVYLPATKLALPADEPKRGLRNASGSETILVVEDDASIRLMTSKVLREHGFKIVEAEDGIQALAIAQAMDNKIDLLLTDVIMPRMGGRQLANELSRFVNDLRILFMSGYTENAIVHRGALDPGLEFLAKPFTPEQLVRKVSDVLATRPRKRSVVVVGRAGASREALCETLTQGGYSLASLSSAAAFGELSRVQPVDLLIAFYPDSSAPEPGSLETFRDQLPHGHILVLQEQGPVAVNTIVDATIEGPLAADDLLSKVRSMIGPFGDVPVG